MTVIEPDQLLRARPSYQLETETPVDEASLKAAQQSWIACSAVNLTREGRSGERLDDVSVSVERGAAVVLAGAPGSGARELLRALAGLEQIDQGRVFLDGRDLSRLSDPKRQVVRARTVYVGPRDSAGALADSVARACRTRPGIIFIDLFGGAVSLPVLAAVRRCARRRGGTLVVATDDADVIASAERVVRLEAGRLVCS